MKHKYLPEWSFEDWLFCEFSDRTCNIEDCMREVWDFKQSEIDTTKEYIKWLEDEAEYNCIIYKKDRLTKSDEE